MAVSQSSPVSESIDPAYVARLERKLDQAESRIGRLHSGMVLLHQLQRETGSLQVAGRLVAQWTGMRADSAERIVRMIWNEGKPPALATIQKLAATVQRDRLPERVARLEAHRARVEVDLAAIDAAEAGTKAPRLDAIG